MKVQLIVVQGKPEGKVIPLTLPVFRIGRGETCHLRPSSEQVSREHAEFSVAGDKVMVRDLGSRNGTLVNGKAITEQATLKDRDLVQVGPLTFAVSIQGAPAVAAKAAAAPVAPKAAAKPASPDDVANDDIDSWLVSDNASPVPERPSGVYGGDTITIAAFKDAGTVAPAAAQSAPPAPVDLESGDDEEYERLPEGTEGSADETMEMEKDEKEDEDESESSGAAGDELPEEFIDESNPFYVKKKPKEAAPAAKPAMRDSSDAAGEILRKMMERRRAK